MCMGAKLTRGEFVMVKFVHQHAQRAGKALFLGVSDRVFPEEISIKSVD